MVPLTEFSFLSWGLFKTYVTNERVIARVKILRVIKIIEKYVILMLFS